MAISRFAPTWLTLFWLVACDVGSVGPTAEPASGSEDPEEIGAVTGCEPAAEPRMVAGGYYVNGNTICTADGQAHLLHGVNRPGLEYSHNGDHLSERDFRLMASWGANVVRMGLNQDFWLQASPKFDPNYVNLVDSAVHWAEAAGMDVILDLHWSDAGVLGGCKTTNCQQKMADANSLTFWSEVAERYRDDGRVLFELYNEPHDVSWDVWKSGGSVDGFQAAGMQQLYDAVRAAGAENLVIVGGLDWAFDLSGVPAHRLDGYNIVYATHPYNTPQRQPASWPRAWGSLTATDPVIVTEFGNLNDESCSTEYSSAVIDYADAHHAGWTAWAWYPGGCNYPALIEDWTATPSEVGAVVQAALLGYGGPHPAVEPEDETPLSFDFDDTTEAWVINDYHDPDFTNLGAVTPGVEPVRLSWGRQDGDPKPGSLELRLTISAVQQYVMAQAPVVKNLAGKTLHARVRLKAGTLNGASVALHACTGANFACSQGPRVAPVVSEPWTLLEWDLAAVTEADFDATRVVSVGVLVDATTSADGSPRSGSLPSSGEATLQIDSVGE